MSWPRPVILLPLRKRYLLILLGLALLLLGSWGVYSRAGFRKPPPAPEQFLAEALLKTASSRSFCFRVEARLGEGGLISQVEGERAGPDAVHIRGTMYNSPVEFIQVGGTTYMRDPWTSKWLTLEGNRMWQSDLFVAEFNPLGFLKFKEVLGVSYRGKEKVDGEQVVVLECYPQLENPYLEMKYSDYYCKVWISPRDNRIRQLTLEGRAPGGRRGLFVGLKLWDYDRPLEVKPPV
ncbi:hypothetical protein [Desulfovirgula thermocuniculi]|uniref:hypothetical protein n=1 Tax=Desulfovirgula thermocuniculi TaxID=348842 RepID=UPI0003FC6637|nr:hypothetical protein [Desulfovirgula thermocuniculi]